MNTFSLKKLNFYSEMNISFRYNPHVSCVLLPGGAFFQAGFYKGVLSLTCNLIGRPCRWVFFQKNFFFSQFIYQGMDFQRAKGPCPQPHGQKKVKPGFEPCSIWALLMISWFQGSGGRHSPWVSANVSTPWIISSSRTEGGKRRGCSEWAWGK